MDQSGNCNAGVVSQCPNHYTTTTYKARSIKLKRAEGCCTCDRQLNALNMSKKTKHVKVIVVSRRVILSSASYAHTHSLVQSINQSINQFLG